MRSRDYLAPLYRITHNSQSCSVEAAVAAAEGGVRDEAAPGLAHEGGADEARGISRLEAEEDFGDEVVHQLRQRPTAAVAEKDTISGLADAADCRLQRRHAAGLGYHRRDAEGFGGRGAPTTRSQVLY
ncbi:hypothetical protein PVAP13_3NG153302 [Panicum virgatum]|uniref:Uncharacterized protein n=1 Tax=Panicum virgatum TaxID=38727 RepID=A0A8T0UHI5_PANVG|nr:hypothetical protein PVAP13_3NG153301 [Panicum virgatum]KAG2619969.1 hypothetical protein PVAP13_3NG153302 [Panicum virgatum]